MRSTTQRKVGKQRYAKHEGRTGRSGRTKRRNLLPKLKRRSHQSSRRSMRSTIGGRSRSRTNDERSRTGGF